MSKRICLHILNQRNRYLVFILLCTVIFVNTLSSFFFVSLSDSFEKYIENDVGIYLSVSSKVNNKEKYRKIYDSNAVKYISEIDQFMEYHKYIDGNTDFLYTDMPICISATTEYIIQDDILKGIYYIPGSSTTLQEQFNKCSYEYDNGFVSHGNVIVTTSSESVQPLDFKLRKRQIVSGRLFSETELADGDSVCVVSDNLKMAFREGNTLIEKEINVGDFIDICYVIDGNEEGYRSNEEYDPTFNTVRYKVIGKYHTKSNATVLDNTIYVPENYLSRLWEDMNQMYDKNDEYHVINGNNVAISVDPMIYQIENFSALESFVNEIEATRGEEYEYYVNTAAFTNVISSVTAISKGFKRIGALCFVVSLMLMLTLTYINVIFSKKEIGLLLSLGSSKKAVIMQYIIIDVLIICISMTIAFYTSQYIVFGMKDYIISGETIVNNSVLNDFVRDFGKNYRMINLDFKYSMTDYCVLSFFIALTLCFRYAVMNRMIDNTDTIELLRGF